MTITFQARKMGQMTEALRAKIAASLDTLSLLWEEKLSIQERIKQTEKEVVKAQAELLGISPDSALARNAGAIIKFAEEKGIDPQWLASNLSWAIRDVLQITAPRRTRISETSTHEELYQEAIELIKTGCRNSDNPYVKVAAEYFAKAKEKARLEEQNVQIPTTQNMSAFYEYLEGFAFALQKIAHDNYWNNY